MEPRVLILLLQALLGLGAAQSSDSLEDLGLEECFSDQSICTSSLEIDCSDESDDDWYECLCETGYLAARQACDECQLVYGLEEEGRYYSLFASCDEMGYTVAPIPSSMLDAWSSHNATGTVWPSGGGGAAITGSPGGDGDSDSPRTSVLSDLTATDADSPTRTTFGGGGGGGRPTVTAQDESGPPGVFNPFSNGGTMAGGEEGAAAAAGLDRDVKMALAALCGFGVYWVVDWVVD